MNSIPEEDRAPSVKNFQERETLIKHALGVKYDVKTDMLVFEVAKLFSKVGEKGEKMTKRKTHSFVHSIYDPIGILSPITLILKMLTQKYAK
jgi:type IV secretory pathway VirB9-like protein